MNILVDNLVDKIEVDGTIYEIDTDFRNCLKIIIAWEDDYLTNEEKVYITLDRLFGQIPENVEMAFKKSILFLNLGEESDEKDTKSRKRLYSFKQDSKYIFSGVDRATGGKLSSGVKYHWWLFITAFMEMPQDCFFSNIINLREKKYSGKLSKEERTYWKKNRDILELEENIIQATDQEIENMKKFDELIAKKKRLKEGVENANK